MNKISMIYSRNIGSERFPIVFLLGDVKRE